MCSRARWQTCVPAVRRWVGAVAVLFACGSPGPGAAPDGAHMDAPHARTLASSELTGSPAPAELSGPTEPSGLLLALGGQTGSENAQTPDACAPIRAPYELSEVSPLGFAGSELVAVVGQRDYWASGLAAQDGPVDVLMELTSATFIDRDPNASPDAVCADVLRVVSRFTLSSGDQTLAQLSVELYADAPDHFAGFGWLGATSLQGALAETANGSEVIVDVESTGDGLRFWFSRLDATEREILGRVVPVP